MMNLGLRTGVMALLLTGLMGAESNDPTVIRAGGPGIIVNPVTDNVLAQLADGGDGWTTTFFLTNLEPSKTVNWSVSFYGDTGFPLAVPIVNQPEPVISLFAALPPEWSVSFQTAGTSAVLLQGWASVLTYDRPANQPGAMLVTDRLGGLAVFRQRIAGRPDFEAVVPINSSAETRFVMPFDNRAGYSTGIALLNPNRTAPASVELVLRREDGMLLRQDSFTLGPGAKLTFSMPERYFETIGRIGRLAVSTTASRLSGLGLRFNPTGAFTSFHALSTSP